MYKIEFYQLDNGKEPVKDWLVNLDTSIRVKIIKRIERLYTGNFGDSKLIAPGLYEMRFKLGKGYRIYYTIRDNILILLLNAGDKTRQGKDIELARQYLAKIEGDNNVRF